MTLNKIHEGCIQGCIRVHWYQLNKFTCKVKAKPATMLRCLKSCRFVGYFWITSYCLTVLILFTHRYSWQLLCFIGRGLYHNDVIKWKHFPRCWPFVRGIHRSPVNSPHKGQWCGALMFSLICGCINGWVNNREAGDLRRLRAHYDVTVMYVSRQFTNRHMIWTYNTSEGFV